MTVSSKTGGAALASTSSSEERKDFVGAMFYCLHALADGNQRIRIMEKMLEFSTVSYTLSLYLITSPNNENPTEAENKELRNFAENAGPEACSGGSMTSWRI